MHDTAYEIGRKFFELYCDPSCVQIVDIGSANINGTLRDHCPAGCSYLGIDFDAGAGVNLIAVSGQNLPVEKEIADLIVSTSAFEHDPQFWVTFLELCRVVKNGGYIYINAPSNGYVHRYPLDCWRFYPDSSRALLSWAKRNGYDIKLVESFVANRMTDVWNDFVAVFQKSPFSERSDENCLFSHFSCLNILRGSDPELRKPTPVTEDQRLLAQARSDRHASEVTQILSSPASTEMAPSSN